jgi:hypothetical protein
MIDETIKKSIHLLSSPQNRYILSKIGTKRPDFDSLGEKVEALREENEAKRGG